MPAVTDFTCSGGGPGFGGYVITTNGTETLTYTDLQHSIRHGALARLREIAANHPEETPVRLPNLSCPKCGGRAVRHNDGSDVTLQFHDHDKREEKTPGHVSEYVANGAVFYIRICASCLNVFASKRAPVETTAKAEG